MKKMIEFMACLVIIPAIAIVASCSLDLSAMICLIILHEAARLPE